MKLKVKYKGGKQETIYPENIRIEDGRIYYAAIGGQVCINTTSQEILGVTIEDDITRDYSSGEPWEQKPYNPFGSFGY